MRAEVVQWCSTVGNSLGVLTGVGQAGLRDLASDIVARYGCRAAAVFSLGPKTPAHLEAEAKRAMTTASSPDARDDTSSSLPMSHASSWHSMSQGRSATRAWSSSCHGPRLRSSIAPGGAHLSFARRWSSGSGDAAPGWARDVAVGRRGKVGDSDMEVNQALRGVHELLRC